ncbi:hypothetical protein [Streptomyces sp. XY431]|uniref:hypothetical protein n=1 Tax=Streptomyces sp. XY431 TaxID=1415562 RepID=UPI000A7CE309|nr:hypothetical protein [Streptomyces sp. XY431]
MPGDKRRIQTAVLGSANSDEPLILPLEAIELDAFRRRHTEDSFWCGLLLGGCGERLTTKLYTDRVCHFAHLPDPTGLHRCERRARDVSSADHLYVKSAATTWLLGLEHQGVAHLREPLGSVVDIVFEHQDRGMRLHLDSAVAPAWDEDRLEPVLGTAVPVDVDTLVRRRYIHRVRLDSAGTSREVRIGTQAPARGTEWFSLDECHMSPDGFRTPAVEEILATAKPTVWRPASFVTPRKPTAAQRLEGALRSGSILILESECRAVESGGPYQGAEEQIVAGLLEQARQWLDQQKRLRADLFGRLAHAVKHGDEQAVHSLLVQVNFKAARDRTLQEHQTSANAARLLKDLKRQAAQAARAEHAPKARRTELKRKRIAESVPPQPKTSLSETAHQRMTSMIADLQHREVHLEARDLVGLVDELAKMTTTAAHRVTRRQREEVNRWIAKADRLRPQATAAPSRTPQTLAAPSEPATGTDDAKALPAKARRSPRATSTELADAAAAVRSVLEMTAREQGVLSWATLRRQLGGARTLLDSVDRMAVLLEVEKETTTAEPMLSSLLAADGASSLTLYRSLSARLGRDLPSGDAATRAHWQREILRLQELYQH